MITFQTKAGFNKSAIVLLFSKEAWEKKEFPAIPQNPLRQELLRLHKNKLFSAGNAEIFPLSVETQLVLLVGLGKKDAVTTTSIRTSMRQALVSSYLKKLSDVEIIPHTDTELVIRAIIEGVLIGGYTWRKYKSEEKDVVPVDKKHVYLVAEKKKIYDDMITVCEGVTLARDLVNDNADLVTSTYLEKIIRDLIRDKKNVSLAVLNKKELQQKGLNLHLAVNQGSPKEPKLIIVKYHGDPSPKAGYTAIVGKGITFDTGGLNIKPSGHIETMRSDMSGAAAVIGALKNVLALSLRKNIIFAVGVAENAVGSCAYKPGDVFKSYNGKTVEIANTDAEGRLVLADALSYIAKNYKPARLLDIATLTGACVVALGHDYTGLVASDETLAAQLLRVAEITDDRIWRLPSYPELKDAIKSPVADMKNTGFPKGAGGTITAAEFLRQFTENIPWAHLDIAGTAFLGYEGRFYYGAGATGAGVRLLTEYFKTN